MKSTMPIKLFERNVCRLHYAKQRGFQYFSTLFA